MENWKTYKLEDAIEKLIDYRGKTPKKTTHGVPLVTAKVIKGGRILEPNEFISKEDYEPWMRRGIPEVGDVVLTTEAPLGEVAQIKSADIALAQRVITLRGKVGVLHSGYLKYFLQSSIGQSRLEARQSGTTVFGIKQTELRKVEVDCPLYSEQQVIASILSAIDDKIENNLAMNKTFEEMAMALYKHWFVNSDTILDNTLADYVHLNPRLSIKKGEVATYVNMKALPTDGMSVSEVDRAVVKGGAKFQNGDTLLARITPCLENGKTAFVDFLEENEIGFGSTEFLVLRPKKRISKYWVYCLSRDINLVNHAVSCMIGTSGRQRVQNDPFLQYELPKIDKNLMKEFEIKVEPWFKKVKTNTNENQTLTQLRDTLLPKLISGEVRIKEFEEKITAAL